jgi:hypothetical protein
MCDCNSADEHVVAAIEQLCDEIRFRRIEPGEETFDQTIEAIATLRASMNPTIIQQSR